MIHSFCLVRERKDIITASELEICSLFCLTGALVNCACNPHIGTKGRGGEGMVCLGPLGFMLHR